MGFFRKEKTLVDSSGQNEAEYTRKVPERAVEAARSEETVKKIYREQYDTIAISNIKNRLGLSQKATRDDVVKELKRLRSKSDKTWQALKLNKKETLKIYGIPS